MSLPSEVPDAVESTLLGKAWSRILQSLSLFTSTRWLYAEVTVVGLICGHYLMLPYVVRLAWLVLLLPFTLMLLDWGRLRQNVKSDPLPVIGIVFLAFMCLRSMAELRLSQGQLGVEAADGVIGAMLQAAFAVLIWHAACRQGTLERVGWWTGLTAAFTASASILLYYFILPGHIVGERLMNWFVYQDGLNPVCTGLLAGFACLWMVCQHKDVSNPKARWLSAGVIIVLLVAMLFTRSRGALIALMAGGTVWMFMRGVRKCLVPCLAAATVAVVFQLSGPLLFNLMHLQKQARLGPVPESLVSDELKEMEGFHNPAKELVSRWDNGRFQLYRSAMQVPRGWDWMWGIGQWNTDDRWQCGLHWKPEHMHSVFLSTLIHGGAFAFALLMAMLAIGFLRAFHLAREGNETWIALLTYGCAGLCFDGHTLTSFNSIPRVESLLIVLPLVAAAGLWNAKRQPAETSALED